MECGAPWRTACVARWTAQSRQATVQNDRSSNQTPDKTVCSDSDLFDVRIDCHISRPERLVAVFVHAEVSAAVDALWFRTTMRPTPSQSSCILLTPLHAPELRVRRKSNEWWVQEERRPAGIRRWTIAVG